MERQPAGVIALPGLEADFGEWGINDAMRLQRRSQNWAQRVASWSPIHRNAVSSNASPPKCFGRADYFCFTSLEEASPSIWRDELALIDCDAKGTEKMTLCSSLAESFVAQD
jgi:hypothetical protein